MRYPVLASLAAAPAHGYEIKRGLEERFGSAVAPLNIGQVYTSLQRLQRDELVVDEEAVEGGRERRVYRLTDAGRRALEEWVGTASGPTRLRDDFFMKLVFAREIGLADPAELIARQRALYLGALRDLENVLADGDADATTSLVVEGAALHLEADLKWLDRCEAVLGTEIDMTAVLETTGLGKLHGEGAAAVTALADVDLTVRQGEFVAVTGPSGCGKSTLLNLLGGLDRPTSGEVLVHGERLAGASEARRARLRRSEVGFVFQFFNLIANLTVADNVELPALLAGVPGARGAAARGRAARAPRAGGDRAARARRSLRRPAAARRDRAGADQPSERAARRRADRQPRHRRRPRGRGGAARAPRRRPDDRARHPRHARRERRRARGGDARRPDRGRDAPSGGRG